jgi:hypothetical protein
VNQGSVQSILWGVRGGIHIQLVVLSMKYYRGGNEVRTKAACKAYYGESEAVFIHNWWV